MSQAQLIASTKTRREFTYESFVRAFQAGTLREFTGEAPPPDPKLLNKRSSTAGLPQVSATSSGTIVFTLYDEENGSINAHNLHTYFDYKQLFYNEVITNVMKSFSKETNTNNRIQQQVQLLCELANLNPRFCPLALEEDYALHLCSKSHSDRDIIEVYNSLSPLKKQEIIELFEENHTRRGTTWVSLIQRLISLESIHLCLPFIRCSLTDERYKQRFGEFITPERINAPSGDGIPLIYKLLWTEKRSVALLHELIRYGLAVDATIFLPPTTLTPTMLNAIRTVATTVTGGSNQPGLYRTNSGLGQVPTSTTNAGAGQFFHRASISAQGGLGPQTPSLPTSSKIGDPSLFFRRGSQATLTGLTATAPPGIAITPVNGTTLPTIPSNGNPPSHDLSSVPPPPPPPSSTTNDTAHGQFMRSTSNINGNGPPPPPPPLDTDNSLVRSTSAIPPPPPPPAHPYPAPPTLPDYLLPNDDDNGVVGNIYGTTNNNNNNNNYKNAHLFTPQYTQFSSALFTSHINQQTFSVAPAMSSSSNGPAGSTYQSSSLNIEEMLTIPSNQIPPNVKLPQLACKQYPLISREIMLHYFKQMLKSRYPVGQTLLHILFDVHPLVKFSPFFNISDMFTSENGQAMAQIHSTSGPIRGNLIPSASNFRPAMQFDDIPATGHDDFALRDSITLNGAGSMLTNQKHNHTAYYMSYNNIDQNHLPMVPQIPYPRPPFPPHDIDIMASLHPSADMVKAVFRICLSLLPQGVQFTPTGPIMPNITPAQTPIPPPVPLPSNSITNHKPTLTASRQQQQYNAQKQQQQPPPPPPHQQQQLQNKKRNKKNKANLPNNRQGGPIQPPPPPTIITPMQYLLQLRDEEGCTPLLKFINYRSVISRCATTDRDQLSSILIFLLQNGANPNDVQIPIRLLYTMLPQSPGTVRYIPPVVKHAQPKSAVKNHDNHNNHHHNNTRVNKIDYEEFNANNGLKLASIHIGDDDNSSDDDGFVIQVKGGMDDYSGSPRNGQRILSHDKDGSSNAPRHNQNSPDHPINMLPQQYVLTKQIHLMTIHYLLSVPFTNNTPIVTIAMNYNQGALDGVDQHLLELLLILGGNPNHVTLSQDTALRIACRNIATKKTAIPILLQYRACARYDGTYKITLSPLYLCLQSNCELPIIRSLIYRGAQVNKVVNYEPGPLFHAVNVHLQQAKRLGERNPNVINFLIQAKANINEVDDDNETVLMKAVRVKGSKLLVQLLTNGSNLCFVNNQGKQVSDLALAEYQAFIR